MSKKIFATLAVLLLLSSWFPASAVAATAAPVLIDPPTFPKHIIIKDTWKTVEIRPGVTASMNAVSYINPHSENGKTVEFVAGFAHNGSCYLQLIKEMYEQPNPNLIKEIIVLDLPGHGKSGKPQGMKIGDMGLQDFLTAIEQFNKKLKEDGHTVDLVVGHSQGGLLLEWWQSQESLAELFPDGIVAIASPSPEPYGWDFIKPGAFDPYLFLPYMVMDPVDGNYFSFLYEFFIGMFYSMRDESINSEIPSYYAVENSIKAIAPSTAAFDLVGLDVIPISTPPYVTFETNLSRRPYIEAGALANIPFYYIGFGQDILISDRDRDVFGYLTGSSCVRCKSFLVKGAVHDAFVTPSGAKEVAKILKEIIKDKKEK